MGEEITMQEEDVVIEIGGVKYKRVDSPADSCNCCAGEKNFSFCARLDCVEPGGNSPDRYFIWVKVEE